MPEIDDDNDVDDDDDDDDDDNDDYNDDDNDDDDDDDDNDQKKCLGHHTMRFGSMNAAPKIQYVSDIQLAGIYGDNFSASREGQNTNSLENC